MIAVALGIPPHLAIESLLLRRGEMFVVLKSHKNSRDDLR